MRRSGLPLATSGSRANNTPCQTPLCPKRRPPHPQQPIFSIFRRGGLHFEHHTTTNRDLTTTKRGNFATRGSDTSATRHQKASYRKTPPAPVRRLPEGQAAVPVGGGRAWPGFETTHRAKLAARTASGRATAHGHTKQPGPTGVEGAGGTGGHGRACQHPGSGRGARGRDTYTGRKCLLFWVENVY